MLDKQSIIYYLSEDLIDQIYRSRFGPLEEKTLASTGERAKGITGRFGISKLVAFLGLTSDVEAKGESKTGTKEERKILESTDDRALVLLREAFISRKQTNITDVGEHAAPHLVYFFEGPIHLDYKRVPGKRREYFVQVIYRTDRVEVFGVTSKDNWASESLRTNLLLQSAESRGEGVLAAGLLTPLAVDRGKIPVRVSAQFLILFHPSMIRGAETE
jgi:hypothetical protein